MKVRWKLVAILAVPLAALLGLAGLGVSQRNNDANEAEQAADLTLLASKVTAAANDLQLEANWSAWFITTGGLQGANELKDQRVKTDASMTTLHDSLVGFDASAFSDDFSTKLTLTADRMLGYQMIRPSVDQLAQNGSDPIALYALSGSQLLDLNSLIADESPDDSLAGAFSSYVAGSKAKQFNSDSFSIITESLGGAVLTDQHYSQLVRTQLDHQTQLGVFLSLATPEQKERYRRTVSGPAVSATEDGVTEVIAAGVGAPITLDATDWQADTITTLTLGRSIETDVENGLLAQASQQKSDAQRDVIAYALLALSAAAFAIASAAFLGRAITRPLRRLAVAAHEVADEQLPSLVEALRNPSEDGSVAVPAITPVERTSRDEVGDLAEAFASIQQTAVDVAIEQSNLLRKGIGELFVNLARRNQSLLDRQIGFLDQLEAAETDPDALENLFKLDHLATRMRRNAESLLVLAGIEAPRRWGKPVALGDVVRAAVGEVEDYSRVHVAALDDVYVLGNAAADVAHLLSELLDNATQFSAPGTRVEVIGRRKGGGYLLSVSDLGIGMTGQQLAESNQLLAHPPVTGLTLSRSLGFIVVGRLAKRYGVTVELTSAAVGGLTALVEVPPIAAHDSFVGRRLHARPDRGDVALADRHARPATPGRPAGRHCRQGTGMDTGRGRARRGVGAAHRDQPRAGRRVGPPDGCDRLGRRPDDLGPVVGRSAFHARSAGGQGPRHARGHRCGCGDACRGDLGPPDDRRRARGHHRRRVAGDVERLAPAPCGRQAGERRAADIRPSVQPARHARTFATASPQREWCPFVLYDSSALGGDQSLGPGIEPLARGDPLVALELSQRPHPRSPERRTQVPHQWFSERR